MLKIFLNKYFLFFYIAIFLLCGFQNAKAYGAPDYLPDGPHPRIWLTPGRLSELKIKRDSSDPEWLTLLNYCEVHKNDTGYDVQYNPASWQSTWDGVPINQDGAPGGSGYRGGGYASQMINFALCYQIIKDVDSTKADEYATHGIAVMHGLVNSFSVGEESNGLAIIRVGERQDGTLNATESTVFGFSGTSSYKQGYSARNVGLGMAVAYDWFYDRLSAPEKTKFYSTMFRWIDWYRGERTAFNNGVLKNGIRYYEDQDGDCTGNNVCTSVTGVLTKGYGFTNPASNYYSGFFEMVALSAMATYETSLPDTHPYLDIVVNESWNNFLKPALESSTQYKGGDSPEGWNYGSGWNRIIESLYSLDTASGRDEFSGFDFPKEFLRSYMHATAPTLNSMVINGEWTGSVTGRPYESFVLAPTYIIKKKYPLDNLGKIGQYYLNNANFAYLSDNWQRFLWGDYVSETKSFSEEPLFYRNIGTGLITMRSTWNNSVDSVFGSAQLGAIGLVSHENYDEGNILIQRGDDKLLVHENMKGASVAHNTIVFNNLSHHASNPLLVQPAIDRIINTSDYLYTRAELSNAYKRQWNADRSKLFYRNILYLRPGYFIVYDTTQSNIDLGNIKDWYTHYKADPNIDNDSKTISTIMGNSKIYTKTLFPSSGSFTKCTSVASGESGYCGGAVPGAGFYRVKYTPTISQEYDQFLHVIEATASTDVQTPATLIEGTGGRGTVIENSAENIIAMFTSDQTGADITSLSYSVNTLTISKHIISGLTPSLSYNVSIDSGSASLYVANNAGIIEFENTTSGNHTYVVTSGPVDTTAPSTPTGLSVL